MIESTAEFRLLGNVEVHVDSRLVAIGHARQQAVLVTLLVEANRSVSIDALIDRVWAGQRLPTDPVNALRTYVSLLRRALDGARGAGIVRQSSGYRLNVDPDSIDLHAFHRLIRQAREAGSDDVTAARLDQALQLWRGEPFAGLDTMWIGTMRAQLVEVRRAAQLDLVDARLRLGHHAALAAELSHRAAEHPLDERVAAQLMLALYRCGRQADALAQYQQIRQRLADELGTDPGEPLQAMHRALLTADPSAAPAPGPAAGPAVGPAVGPARGPAGPAVAPAVVPAQLPAGVPHFAGRAMELAQLHRLIDRSATAVIALSGTAGVGKTALALHWAHQIARPLPGRAALRQPARVRPRRSPGQPGEADCADSCDALGVAAPRIPADLDAQAGLYRSLLAERRILVVLDNARDSDQVRPLLPGSSGCLAVVTSRNRLAGLVAAEAPTRCRWTCSPWPRPGSCWPGASGRPGWPPSRRRSTRSSAGAPGSRWPWRSWPPGPPPIPGFPLAALAARTAPTVGNASTCWRAPIRRSTSRAVFSWSYQALAPRPPGCSACSACTPAPTSPSRPRPAWPAAARPRPGRCWSHWPTPA